MVKVIESKHTRPKAGSVCTKLSDMPRHMEFNASQWNEMSLNFPLAFRLLTNSIE